MNIDQPSFILGVFVGAGLILTFHFIMFILTPWRKALTSGAPVPLLCIVGMRLRGNPPMLLIDAYIKLRKMGVDVSIAIVEVVYITNKGKARTPDILATLVMEQLEKNKNK